MGECCDMTGHRVILLLASNILQEKHLAEAHRRLSQMLSDMRLSLQLWSEPYNSCIETNINLLDNNGNRSESSSNQLEDNGSRFETNNDSHAGMYLNQLVYGTTMLELDSLQLWLKQTELDMGRTREAKLSGEVCIDIDLLEYDGVRYHLKDWERDYVMNLF